ncbi:hypothetical protein HHA04nite_27580 [Halomonas halophila]|uniref:Uncharacterized protein n=1 Tax=Halomonas halophila TaxID=29573 RepID=A0ABQ0U6S0_9GAMM|nr:hypothetical protein HHA04nite_27580 [Halomonas halophila]
MTAPATTGNAQPSSELTTRQQILASNTLADAIGALAKQGYSGDVLKQSAADLATALRDGLIAISHAPATCSEPPASREPQ